MENQALDRQQRATVNIAALTAVGNLEQLKTALTTGLDAGLSINEIKEVLVQLYAYCGFPRALNGINTFMKVLDERKANGTMDKEGRDASPIADKTNKYQIGKQTLQKLTGREEKGVTGANAFAPALDTFLKEHLFADIFSRDVLNYQQRELVTISALAAMTGVEPQLKAHIGIGMNTGITVAQVKEIISAIETTIGKKQADAATQVLHALIANQKQE